MGTVWLFKPSDRHSFEQLCTSRMVERFGKDESNWEHIELEVMTQGDVCNSNESLNNPNCSSMNIESEAITLSNYEIERQKRIDENRLALLQLVSLLTALLSPRPLPSLFISYRLTFVLEGVDIRSK